MMTGWVVRALYALAVLGLVWGLVDLAHSFIWARYESRYFRGLILMMISLALAMLVVLST
jgi:hypothetical protein